MNWIALGKKIAAAGFTAAGGALAGPGGAMVGKRIAEALGVEAEPDAIARAMIHDPNAEVILTQEEARLAAELSADQVKLAEIEANERTAMRTSPEHLQQDATRRKLTYALLIIVPVLMAAFATLDAIFEVGAEIAAVIAFFLGAIARDLSSALAYWFGTTLGSTNKGRDISEIVTK